MHIFLITQMKTFVRPDLEKNIFHQDNAPTHNDAMAMENYFMFLFIYLLTKKRNSQRLQCKFQRGKDSVCSPA